MLMINQSIWAIYANDEEMEKGNLKYIKNKILGYDIENDLYLEVFGTDGLVVDNPMSCSNFIGIYEEETLDTEDFINDLKWYFNNKLNKGE